jgi:predicted DNA-binding transcriptional regulator YafY
LAVRRVERQQALIERLQAAHGTRLPAAQLARELRVSERTVTRDVERLRSSGVPVETRQGRDGGISLRHVSSLQPIVFDLAEAAALMSSLAALGPSVSTSATSAMDKLVAAMRGSGRSHPAGGS